MPFVIRVGFYGLQAKEEEMTLSEMKFGARFTPVSGAIILGAATIYRHAFLKIPGTMSSTGERADFAFKLWMAWSIQLCGVFLLGVGLFLFFCVAWLRRRSNYQF